MKTDLFSGKTALVTGCGRGIGKAIALTLALQGADIILNDVDKDSVEGLARELARYQITVNAVAPGFIDTPMTSSIPDNIKQAMVLGIPLGRIGNPQDVANVVKFLASDEAAYVTGQIISCNGGLYI